MGNQHGNGISTPTLAGSEKPKRGPYDRGEGWTPLSDELVNREFTPELSDGELLVLLVLNRHAWKARKLVIEASASLLARQLRPIADEEKLQRDKKGRKIVPGERTVERHLKQLRKLGYLRLHRKGHEREGNQYFVEPVFVRSDKWHELNGIEVATCLRSGELDFPNVWFERWYRQNGGTTPGTAKMAEQYRQNGGTGAASAGTRYRQNGGDPRSRSSDQVAHSVITTNQTAGGDERPGKRSPSGEDQTPGQKGVGLSADQISENEYLRKYQRLWIEHKTGKLNRKLLEQKLDALAKEYGKETHFTRTPAHPRKKKSSGRGGEEQVPGQESAF